MGNSCDNKCVVYVSVCLCISVLTSVRACMHVMGGGGWREGDSRPIHIHTVKCGEITITHVTDSWMRHH